MFYAVIDTNVLVSAMLKADSHPGEVIIESLIGSIRPVLNQEILDEYNEVLRRKKFKFKEENVSAVVEGIKDRALFVEGERIDIDFPDPKDVVFYEVVLDARKVENTYLVTGNKKHFPIQTFVVSPKEMIDLINKSGFIPQLLY